MSHVLSMVEVDFGQICLLDKRRKSHVHAHAETHVLLHVDGAEHEYSVDDQPVRLSRDQAVLVNPQVLHGNVVLGGGPSILLMLYLDAEWLRGRDLRHWEAGRPFLQPRIRLDAQMRHHVDAIALSMRSPGDANVVAQIDQWCRELVDAVLAAQHRPASLRFGGFHRSNDFRIRRAIALMQDTLDEPMAIEQLAVQVGLSRARFFDLFRACTGLTPARYYNMLRLDLARHRLTAHCASSIASISRECGFGAQSHFSNFFTGQLGITPSEFRRASQSGRVLKGSH